MIASGQQVRTRPVWGEAGSVVTRSLRRVPPLPAHSSGRMSSGGHALPLASRLGHLGALGSQHCLARGMHVGQSLLFMPGPHPGSGNWVSVSRLRPLSLPIRRRGVGGGGSGPPPSQPPRTHTLGESVTSSPLLPCVHSGGDLALCGPVSKVRLADVLTRAALPPPACDPPSAGVG